MLGIYQAAQSSTLLQNGLCSATPDSIKNQFALLLFTKNNSSGAGRIYWAASAKRLGLVDTEHGTLHMDSLAEHSVARRDP
jgi:hypothetical protein